MNLASTTNQSLSCHEIQSPNTQTTHGRITLDNPRVLVSSSVRISDEPHACFLFWGSQNTCSSAE